MSDRDIEKEKRRDDANHLAYYRIKGLPLPKLIQTKVPETKTPNDTQAEALLKSLNQKLGFVPPQQT